MERRSKGDRRKLPGYESGSGSVVGELTNAVDLELEKNTESQAQNNPSACNPEIAQANVTITSDPLFNYNGAYELIQ